MLTAADMLAVTADPQTNDVATLESTISTSYTDLATVGPTIASVTLTLGQTCLVIVSANMKTGVSTAACAMTFAVSGATTLAAADINAATTENSTQYVVSTRVTLFTATAAGAHTFTAKYKNTNASAIAQFAQRRIIIKKF